MGDNDLPTFWRLAMNQFKATQCSVYNNLVQFDWTINGWIWKTVCNELHLQFERITPQDRVEMAPLLGLLGENGIALLPVMQGAFDSC